MPRICQLRRAHIKKRTGHYSARGAAIGARTVKTGQSKWFVGYKKHSLRLWLSRYTNSVLLIPLMSWAAPANRGDSLFLEPVLRDCVKRLDFVPDFVVGDMAYINMEVQQRLREQLHIGILTRLPPNYDMPKGIEPALSLMCSEGQRLEWLGLNEHDRLHWFVVRDRAPLCRFCADQISCPREFSFAPSDHEIVLGTIPLSTRVGQELLQRVRPWIEAAQSYEKNQLGLSDMFLNSLQLTWTVCLLADTVCLLRAHALLRSPPSASLLLGLAPVQAVFDFGGER